MKKYIAKTNVSVNVVLSNGGNCHVSFDAITGGGSVFYTDDTELIKALENHYKYGRLFRADPTYADERLARKPAPKQKSKPTIQKVPEPMAEQSVPEPVAEQSAPESVAEQPESETTGTDIPAEAIPEETEEIAEDEETGEEESNLKPIVVSDPDAAKAYLAEHFGLSRTKLKSLKAIKEAGAANGIVFEGI